jgi:hypothetical protein
MEILGKSLDFGKMGIILEKQAQTIGNEAKAAKDYYDMLRGQADERRKAYEDAVASKSVGPEGLEYLKKQWEDAEDATLEAQENMLAKTEEWAEALKAVVENKLSGLAQTLENVLTADFGGSFDNKERKGQIRQPDDRSLRRPQIWQNCAFAYKRNVEI